ncbi:hypothetical protein K1T71_004418 [Dendrolimus kikuchii]|uniref:Uncharacterized protein n=1 Tax=Dendrolimus kikuchii TaxID=765133 RepID=A0ACC1D8W0_9NEOP|nr:hypothetical protein K1T71_004418 [Dendrolimus kikuchii]
METLNRSFEPMDIDMSNSSLIDNMDISFDLTDDCDWEITSINLKDKSPTFGKLPLVEGIDDNGPNFNTIKKYHINVKRDVNTDNRNKFIKAIAIIVVLGISLIIAQTLNIKCAEEINIDQLKTDLFHKVHGQSKALEVLVESLKNKETKLLIWFGGTGVGKTYTASLLMERFGRASNLYHYAMPTFNTEFSVDLLLGLTMCKSSMFIIDDVSKDNMQIKASIKLLIDKSKSMDKNITIILIYNCMNNVEVFQEKCDQSFDKQVLSNFKDINILKKVITFEKLSEEHLKKCIENEIGYQTTKTHDLRNVYKNFDVAIDGCKGVHAKMKLFKLIN